MVSQAETIEIHQLRLFVEVARRLGLTAAADHLGLPKSSVSKGLAALERSLGVRLVERSSRRVALTREGENLLHRAESILAEVDRLREHASEERERPEGLVRIAATPEFGRLYVSHVLSGLVRDFPRLKIAMRLDYQAEDLLDLRADFAFRIGRVGDDRLVARPIAAFRRVLVASPTFARDNAVRTPADLEHVNCVLFRDDLVASQWTLQTATGPDETVQVAVTGNVAVRSFSAVMGAVEADLGVAYVPDFVAAAAIGTGRAVHLLPGWVSSAAPIYIAHRVGIERIARVKAVMDHARRALPPALASVLAQIGAGGKSAAA
jgi:DNA-binding transcriptional LysR family regulator